MTAGAALVSVVMPVYNRERYLAQAVESVLSQSYRTVELILVDDGSTDRSAEVARGFGSALRYETQANAGPNAARNRGIELSRGGLLAFLDDDDYWPVDKLRIQVEALEQDPSLEAVFGHVRQFVSPDLDAEAAARLRYRPETLPGVVPGTMLIRREAFDRVGPFDPQWQVGDFLTWYTRARDVGIRERMLPELVLHRRLHDDNLGIRQRGQTVQYVRALKLALDRRRAKGGETKGGDESAARE